MMQLFVGMASQAVSRAHVGVVKDLTHFVRRMAFHTNGHDTLPFPQLTGDDLAVDLLDARVALRAGLRDVVVVDARFRVGVLADVV
jgi:hypothetical protein